MSLVTLEELKVWTGAVNVPDSILQSTLDEAESAILSEVGAPITEVEANSDARAIFYGEELRRAQRLLARRNATQVCTPPPG